MEHIATQVIGGVGLITFTRPHIKNAISLQMVDELFHVLAAFKEDANVKVIVFTGEGDTFVSGGDLTQFMAVRGKAEALPLLAKVGALLDQIDSYPKPTIAMINGHAIGGGCEFAGACHFRFASEQAKLGFVQIGLHITTGWGGGTRLLAKLPESKALRLLLTGERFSASAAKELGFVDDVYPHESLREEVFSFAGQIAAQPLPSIEAYMRMVAWKRQDIPYEQRIQREIEQCAGLWGTENHVASVERFLPKK